MASLRRLFAFALALVAVALSVAFFTGRDEMGSVARLDADNYYYYVVLPSVVVDGDLDLTNQYATKGNWYGFGPTPKGRPGNVFGVGPAVFSAPLFLVGRGVALATGQRRDGFSDAEVVATFFASVLATVGALAVAAKFLRRRFDMALAELAAFATLFGGPLLYYAVRQPGYAHPFGAFFTALFVDVWDRSFERKGPRSLRTWLVLGASFGAVVLARPQLVTWGVLLVAAVVDDVRRVGSPAAWRRRAIGIGGALLAAVLVFAPQMVAWRAIYGSIVIVPQGAGFMWWAEPAVAEVVFSARNGLFAWAPFYAFAGVGLLLSLRTRVGAWLAFGVVLQVIVNGAAWDWWAGGSFGGRRFCSCYVAFAFGAAAFLKWLRAIGVGAVQVGAVVSFFCCVGNAKLAMGYGQPDVRIDGGRSPSSVIKERVPGVIGVAYGVLSDVVMQPARLVFAVRYGTVSKTYDVVVGVHQFDELYPGLNVPVPRDVFELFADGQVPPGAKGLGARGAGVVVRSDRATVLVALNEHRRAIEVDVELGEGAAGQSLALEWNGERVSTRIEGGHVMGVLAPLRRGVNVLSFVGARGVKVTRARLRARADVLPR